MDLAARVQAIKPAVRRSPLPGFEYLSGYGVFASPFESGDVLALRVFPVNDFAPYRTVWHRTPQGAWSIYVDSPRMEIACPRYYAAAVEWTGPAHISLKWTGPSQLLIEMDNPRLEWTIAMTSSPLMRVMNAISLSIPEPLWRAPLVLRAFERMGSLLLDMGDVSLSGKAPNGQYSIMMPRQMFPIASATARLGGEDFGKPVRSKDNPAIGELRLPARPFFAIGQGYFKIRDVEEYQRTIAALHPVAA